MFSELVTRCKFFPAIKDEESLLTPRGTRKVNNYQDAIWIVTGDGNTPPPTEAAVFAEAERLSHFFF